MEPFLLSVLLIVLQLAFLLVIIIATAIVCAGAISVYLDVPFVPTPHRYRRIIDKALRIAPGDTIYELGSGTGGLLIELARKYPNATFVGIELNVLLYAYARALKRLSGNPHNLLFRRENFFDTDLSQPDKVYGYLLNSVMDELLPKLVRETNGMRFVSRAFQFKDVQPAETIRLSNIPGSHGEHLLYVYELIK